MRLDLGTLGSDVVGEQKSGVGFSGLGQVWGSTLRGRPPWVFRVSGVFKVKFRIN